MDKETRAGSPIELRAADDGVTVEGHAAVFDQDANIGGWFIERFAPGAFAESLKRGDDVVFLVNHDGLPLARTRSGTLELAEDARGLHVRSALEAADPDVAQIVPKMQRGDLDKMSIAFVAVRQEWDESGEIPVRTIHQADLYDVSIVTSPAYEGTDIGLRALETYRRSRRDYVAEARNRGRLLDLSVARILRT